MTSIPLTAARPASSKLVVACVVAGLIALVLGAWTSSVGTLRPRRPLPYGVQSAMFALEMLRAEDVAALPTIVRPPVPADDAARTGFPALDEPEQVAQAIRIDFAFILAYATFLVLVGFVAPPLSWKFPYGLLIIAGGLGAAYFDIQENQAILRLLNGLAGPLPRDYSVIKWALLFLTVAAIAPTLIDRDAKPFRRWIGYAGAIAAAATGIEGVIGIRYLSDQVIESAGSRLAIAFALTLLFVSTRQTLRDGLLPALDRLARLPLLHELATWPDRDTGRGVGRSVYTDREQPL
jgi:hypothetical protein